MRWGIIGCGDVTEVKSGPAYQQTEGFELRAVMRRDLEKLQIMPEDIMFQGITQMRRN